MIERSEAVIDGGFLRHDVLAGRATGVDLVARVRRRLLEAEALVALRALDGLSDVELDLLAERERKARPSELAGYVEVSDRRARGRTKWRARWEQMTEEEREQVRAANRERYARTRAEALATERVRHCASPGCCNLIVAVKGDTRFCTARCRNREKMNRYRRRLRQART